MSEVEFSETMFLNKKIRVLINNKKCYYSVIQVVKLTKTHLFFLDKFGELKIFPFDTIDEVYEPRGEY